MPQPPTKSGPSDQSAAPATTAAAEQDAPSRPGTLGALAEVLSTSPSRLVRALAPASASQSGFGYIAAPPDRVQAIDFAAAAAPSLGAGASRSPSATRPAEATPSPALGGTASLRSRRDSSTSSARSTFSQRQDDDENEWGGASYISDARSVLSDAANLFDPNAYLLAREAAEAGTLLEDEESAGDSGIRAWRGRTAEVSERSSLLPPRTGGVSADSRASAASSRFEGSQVDAEAGGTAITLREALVSTSTSPGTNLGLILIAISQMCYSAMNTLVVLLDEREGQHSVLKPRDRAPLGPLEIVAVECFVIWVACTAVMCIGRTEYILLGPPGVRLTLLARGVFGFLSTLFLYMSLELLTLSDATTVSFLAPLATGALAALLLGEPFTLRERLAGLSSMVGVVLIARPAFLFGGEAEGDVPSNGGDTPTGGGEAPELPFPIVEDQRLLGTLFGLLSVACLAAAWVSLRHIGKRASTYHSIAYFSLMSWTLALLGMVLLREPFVIPSSTESCFLLFGVGLFSLCAQVFQTLGLQREKASRAACMSYLQIIFATAAQVTLLHAKLEVLSLVGSVLIVANGAWVASAKAEGDAVVAH